MILDDSVFAALLLGAIIAVFQLQEVLKSSSAYSGEDSVLARELSDGLVRSIMFYMFFTHLLLVRK